MAEVSIVMATYNGASYIEEQIESLFKNTYTNWILEVSDDGSTDKTLSILQKYQEKYPDKILISKNYEQLGSTRNFLEGAVRAKGNYVMFCDQDDVWLPEKIETTLAFMKEREKIAGNVPVAVFTDARPVDAVLRTLHDSFFGYNVLDVTKTDLPHLLMENKVIGCTTMVNRKLIEYIIDFPNCARQHDWWIALIASVFGDLAYLDEVTMLYRQHGKNAVGTQSFLSYLWSRMKDLKAQHGILIKTEKQAWEFYEIYKEYILEEQAQILQDFAYIHGQNFIERRDRLFRYGFWKTGKARNIGVFFLI